MQCPRCGMSHADWVKFCTECGTALAEETVTAPEEAPVAACADEAEFQAAEESQAPAWVPTAPVQEGEKPVSLGKWLGILALEMLCSIAHIVLLFVWGFSRSTEKSLQNYARAKLIVIGASAVLACILVIVLVAVIAPNIDPTVLEQYMY